MRFVSQLSNDVFHFYSKSVIKDDRYLCVLLDDSSVCLVAVERKTIKETIIHKLSRLCEARSIYVGYAT